MFLFFFRQPRLSQISDVPRPIAAKLCHMIGIWVQWREKGQKFGTRSPKKYWGPKTCQISVEFLQVRSTLRISPQRLISKSESQLLLLARTFLTQRRGVYSCRLWDQCKKYNWGPTNDRPHIWGNFKWPYIREGLWGLRGRRSNDAISVLNKLNRYVGENNARGVIRLSQPILFLVHYIKLDTHAI